jgi:hypothetical protein
MKIGVVGTITHAHDASKQWEGERRGGMFDGWQWAMEACNQEESIARRWKHHKVEDGLTDPQPCSDVISVTECMVRGKQA